LLTLPAELLPLIVEFAPLFSKPVCEHAKVLLVGAIFAPGNGSFAVLDLLSCVSNMPHTSLITQLRVDAELWDPAPERKPGQNGRPRVIRKHCQLGPGPQSLLERAITKWGLSARAYDRILKVSDTVADLAGKERIAEPHISEAAQYRALDRDSWT